VGVGAVLPVVFCVHTLSDSSYRQRRRLEETDPRGLQQAPLQGEVAHVVAMMESFVAGTGEASDV